MISQFPPTVSVIVPVHNGGPAFHTCLVHLTQSNPPPFELIVVLDGNRESDRCVAEALGATVIHTQSRSGPAQARNLGAQIAQGEILFFVDADVAVPADALAQVAQIFACSPHLTAAIGSYDDTPGAPNFLSQYKNLFHHYTHQTACTDASTFWGACGAIRRSVFLSMGGFDSGYRRPCVEDIELGYRLKRAGHQILLCKSLQVKHLKRWSFGSLLKADFFDRALPWTALILAEPQIANDLNLKQSNRLSVVLVFGLSMALAASYWWTGTLWLVSLFSLMMLWLNFPVYQFFLRNRGLIFALQTIPWHWFYYLYGGIAFAIGTLRHRWCQLFRGGFTTPHSMESQTQESAGIGSFVSFSSTP